MLKLCLNSDESWPIHLNVKLIKKNICFERKPAFNYKKNYLVNQEDFQ